MTATTRRKNPNALRKAFENLQDAARKEIAVGFPEGKTQAYSGNEHKGFEQQGPIPVPSVAAAHVFGIGVPTRNFMALAKQGMIEKSLAILRKLPLVATNKSVMKKVFEQAGLSAQSEIRSAITELNDPPNSPRTIELKGFNNPLIWTGHLRKSVTYIVRDKGSNK